MMTRLASLIFFFAFALGAAAADLSPGSAERAALLNVVRPEAEKAYGVPVVFRIKALIPKKGLVLAWLEANAKADGKPLGFQRRDNGRRLSGYVYALLERSDTGWKLVASSISHQDWVEFEKTVGQRAPDLLEPIPGSEGRSADDLPPWMRSLPPLPARCLSVEKATEVFDAPRGAKTGDLPAKSALRIAKFDGEWVKVAYAPGVSVDQCSESKTLAERGWIKMSSLPGPAVLAKDFVPLSAEGEPVFRLRQIVTGDPEPVEVELLVPKPLLQASLQGYTGEDLHLYTLYTGDPTYPLAVLYTGFHSDMWGDKSELALFGTGPTITWQADQGNRVTADLEEVKPGQLVIREAFFCSRTMSTTLTIGAAGVVRQSASVYVSLEEDNFGTVVAPITLYAATDRKGSRRLVPGDHLLAVTGYDLKTKLVEVEAKVAGSHAAITGWVTREDLGNLEVPFGAHSCCGCG